MDDTQKTTGAITPSTKFIEFVGGKGYINFISNQATIEGKYLSGLGMDDITFKLTIYEDGTLDFDEVDTTKTTQEERERLLNVILDKTLTPYRNRTVVNELPFLSVEKVKDKNVPLYLAVEYVTPIEKLTSLFDDETIEVSDDAMDNLNDLLNSWFEDEEFAKMVEEMVDEENSKVVEDVKGVIDDTFMKHHDTNINTPTDEIEYTTEDPSGLDIYESSKRMNDYMQSLETSFEKIKEDKLNELKSKKSKMEEEIMKYSFQISSIEKNLTEAKNDLRVIEGRIDDLQPIEPSNGYYFNVSEKQNETVILEPEIESIIKDKVSKVKSINVEAFMKLFTSGEYHIKISKKTDSGFEMVEEYKDLPTDVLEKLSRLDLSIDEGKMIFMGEMAWGEIVNKMIKMGFEQNPDFDKLCGSNSYTSTDETKESAKTKKAKF